MFAADVDLDTIRTGLARLYPRGDKPCSSKTEDDIASVERCQKAIYKLRALPPNNPPPGETRTELM